MTAALIGLGLLMGTAAPLIVVPAFVLIIDRCFIRPEEAVLETTFGDEYRAYKSGYGGGFNAAYQLPVFSIDCHGSAASFAPPFCSNSIEMPSGERMKAICRRAAVG